MECLRSRTISPSLKVFDESDWVTRVDLSSFGLDVIDAPPLDKRQAIPFLKRCLSSLPIEGNAGITVLTIPKGLTFNTLVKLAGSPKVGNTAKFRYIWGRISSEIGDIPVDKTYRIVITNNVFKKSRNLSVSDQKALMSKIGCEMPRVLEATVLLVVTFMSSGERLYSDNPWTYTRCLEQLAGDEVSFFIPNTWKEVSIPFRDNSQEPLNDPRANYQVVVGASPPLASTSTTAASSTATATASGAFCGSSRSLVIGTLVLALDFCPLAFGNLVFSFLLNKHF